MRIFRQKYTSRDGQTRESSNWYLEFRDHRDIVRRLPAFTDKGATGELGRRLAKLVELRSLDDSPGAELARWLEQLPSDLRERLRKIDLLDARTVAGGKPLAEHLADFRESLLHNGTTVAHADLVHSRAKRALDECGFVFYSDISASRVSRFLSELAKDRPAKDDNGTIRGASAQTRNFYLAAAKQFCRFMEKDRRASDNPLAHLDGLNTKTDRRHDRRNLSAAELTTLFTTTATAPTRWKQSGMARAMLYRCAAETGLRRNELASLTVGSFSLDGTELFVELPATKTKNRTAARLPIRPEFADELRVWFAREGMTADTPLWPGLTSHTAKMLRDDLTDAKIAYIDAAGLFADFHSLRHSFVSMLAAGNVSPAMAQRLARHSDINLTMSRYTHTVFSDEATALSALPQFPSVTNPTTTDRVELRATGTDGPTTPANVLPVCLPESDAKQGALVQFGAVSATTETTSPATSAKEKAPKNTAICGSFGASSSGEAGIRTLERVTPSPVFKTGAFNRSATSPEQFRFCSLIYSANAPSSSRWGRLVRRAHRPFERNIPGWSGRVRNRRVTC
jgi:integrase